MTVSGMKSATIKIVGTRPLLMHSGRLSNPLDPATKKLKEITSKRAKTDADLEEMARREFFGGLYMHNDAPCIPMRVLEACLIGGARKFKLGKQAEAGLFVPDHAELEYDGPKSADELWEAGFYLTCRAKVQRAAVMRTRPEFKEWAATFQVDFMVDLLTVDQIEQIATRAGEVVGVGDWRPRYGQFAVEVFTPLEKKKVKKAVRSVKPEREAVTA